VLLSEHGGRQNRSRHSRRRSNPCRAAGRSRSRATTVLAQQHLNTFRERMPVIPSRSKWSAVSGSRAEQKKNSGRRPPPARSISHRHAPAAPGRREIPRTRPRRDRRGAALWREAQGSFQADARHRRRALDERHADPAHAHMALTGARDAQRHRRRAPTKFAIRFRPSSKPTTSKSSSMRIRHEIRRGGQVFYLHNRVMTIDLGAARLSQALPNSASGRAPRWTPTISSAS